MQPENTANTTQESSLSTPDKAPSFTHGSSSSGGSHNHFSSPYCNIEAHKIMGKDTKLRGHIELICGPMFSGKSTELLRRLKRYEIGGHRILRIKFAEDCRYSVDAISTHDR